MKKITESDAKELISMASVAKLKNEKLSSVFCEFARLKNLSSGSVRNYYYKTLSSSSCNDNLREKLGITDNLKPILIEEFSRAEERALLFSVIRGVSLGKSVRKCILDLSGGREKLALRYLNKYRNLIKNNSPLIDEINELVKKDIGFFVDVRKPKATDNEKYKRLEKEINAMLDKILRSVTEENSMLKQKSIRLEQENQKLKNVVKETMKEKQFAKFIM